MPALKGRKTAGLAWRVTPGGYTPPAVTYATGYSATPAYSTGFNNQALSITLAPLPVGAVWPIGAVITAHETGVTATFNPSAALSLQGGSSTSAVVNCTPSTTGTANFTFTNNVGMADPAGFAYTVSTTAPPVTYATGYTATPSASSGYNNQTLSITLTPTPSGSVWPVGLSITAQEAGVTASFNPSATVTPVAGSTSSVVVNAVLTSPGTANFTFSNNGGLSDPSGFAYVVSNPAPPPPPPGQQGTFTALSDLSFVQWGVVTPQMAEEILGGGLKPTLATVYPVNGIGPFVFSFATNAVGFRQWSSATGDILAPYFAAGFTNTNADLVTMTVMDGSGASITKTFSITKSPSAPGVFIEGPLTRSSNQDWKHIYNRVYSYGAGHNMSDSKSIVAGDTTKFELAYGVIEAKGVANGTLGVSIPNGSYPLTVSSVGSGGTVTTSATFQFSDKAISSLVFAPVTVSTSLPVGYVIGRIMGTTPNNLFTFAMTDSAGGKYAIDGVTGYITTASALTVGTDSIAVSVTDSGLVQTATFAIVVNAGVLLPPSNMTMTINSLINAGMGQIVGSPSVTGVTGTKQWLMTQTSRVEQSETGGYAIPARYFMDASGNITAPGILSYQEGFGQPQDQLTVLCTDGINSCIRVFNIPVAEAPAGPTYYVGRGMAAAHPGVGYEHLVDAKLALNNARSTTFTLYWYADADPDWDRGSAGYGFWQGPGRIYGIAANGMAQPQRGSPLANASGGGDPYGQGGFTVADGDMWIDNICVSNVHGSYDLSHGLEAIRKEGNTYGNIKVTNSRFVDCNQGFESGFNPGTIIIENCEFEGGGTSNVSSGNCHNLYIGMCWRAEVRNCISRGSHVGHDLKCRARSGLFEHNRIYDTEVGSASCLIDIPIGGDYVVQNNYIQKGPMALSPGAIQFTSEMDLPYEHWPVLNLLVQNNYIDILTIGGNHFGNPMVLRNYPTTTPTGVKSKVTLLNNSVYLGGWGSMVLSAADGVTTQDPTADYTETGTTFRTAPFALDFTRPSLPGPLPNIAPYWAINQQGDNYANWSGAQIVPSLDDIQVSRAAAVVGATVATFVPRGTRVKMLTGTQPNPATDPFVDGVTITLSTDGVYYAYVAPNPWSTAFAINNSGVLTYASIPAVGVHYIQVKAVSTLHGTIVKQRFYINVTA